MSFAKRICYTVEGLYEYNRRAHGTLSENVEKKSRDEIFHNHKSNLFYLENGNP